MERLQFNLGRYTNKLDKLNVLASYIVNRAAAFDNLKYKRIIVDFNDSAQGCATYNFMLIINTVKNIPIYSNWINKKSRYVVPNKNVHFRPSFWIKYLKKKDDSLYLDAESTINFELSTNDPKIYYGFTKQEIEDIGKYLYGWQDDLQSYKAWRKEMNDKAKELKRADNNN